MKDIRPQQVSRRPYEAPSITQVLVDPVRDLLGTCGKFSGSFCEPTQGGSGTKDT